MIQVIGINHKTASISIREQFFLSPTAQTLLLCELKNLPQVVEAFVLSTCNRTEVYVHLLEGYDDFTFISKMIAKINKIDLTQESLNAFYIHQDEAAITHIFNVVCGLDSLVIGEKQILGQVKFSVERARQQQMLGKHLNVLTNLAIRAGKKAQTETDICVGGSSISWAAIAMAEQQLGTLEQKSVLVIGAGKMGEIALNHIVNKNPAQVYLMNRTGSKAEELAHKYSCQPAEFSDIKELLTEVDVCFCAAGAPHYIIDESLLNKVMPLRNNKKILLIDISMPRNINPDVSQCANVFLNSIDDLDQVLDKNMQRREAALEDVYQIIHQKKNEYFSKIDKMILHV